MNYGLSTMKSWILLSCDHVYSCGITAILLECCIEGKRKIWNLSTGILENKDKISLYSIAIIIKSPKKMYDVNCVCPWEWSILSSGEEQMQSP